MERVEVRDERCRRFEEAWQAHLDREVPTEPSMTPEWYAHLSECATCREADARFRTLSRAIGSLEVGRTVAPRGRARLSRTLRWAAATAALALLLLWWRGGPPPRRDVATDRNEVPTPSVPAVGLGEVIAEASEATISLARAGGTPAVVLGRGLIEAAPRVEVSANALAPKLADPIAGLRRVGSGMGVGMRPLSDGARRAFGFLSPGVATSSYGSATPDA